jgi:hypothetical protein
LRFYQPKDEIINGTWKPPGVMRTGVKISKEP